MARQPRTPEQIRETHGRRHLHLTERAIIPACLRLCAAWHNALGGCLTLDRERLGLLHRRLVIERDPCQSLEDRENDLRAAIDAYAKECETSVDRRKKGIPPRTFASFLMHDGLESWIERGLAARGKDAAVRERSSASAQADAEKRVILAAIAQAAAPLGVAPEHHFGTVLRQAYLELSAEDPQVGSTFDDPRLRARMLAITQRAAPPAGGCGTGVPPVGGVWHRRPAGAVAADAHAGRRET